jgi:cell division protein FtsB
MQLLAEPIEAAPQSLQDRISSLEATIAQLKEENAAMAATQATLSDNQLIQLQLIKQLREGARREPQPMQKDRAEILHALLAANGGKMLAKDARQKMHIKKNHFAELLRVCDFIDTKQYHLDRRQTVIILKSELVPRD